MPYGVGYSASKFGLRGFSGALKGELSEYKNIHVCDMYPAFLDSPGMQHAANYTGHVLRPAPPVYDPQRLARAVVKVALRPRRSVSVGSMTHLLRFAYALFPAITRNTTAKVVREYLDKAEPIAVTSGNLFAPSNFGTSIHGGWNSDADYDIRKKSAIKTAVVAGVATGLFLLLKNKLVDKPGK